MGKRGWIVVVAMALSLAAHGAWAGADDDLANLDKCSGWEQCQKLFDTYEHYKNALARKLSLSKDNEPKYEDGDANARENARRLEAMGPEARKAKFDACVKNSYNNPDTENCEKTWLVPEEIAARHPAKPYVPTSPDVLKSRVTNSDRDLARRIDNDCASYEQKTFSNRDICRGYLKELNALQTQANRDYPGYMLTAATAAGAAGLPQSGGKWDEEYQAAAVAKPAAPAASAPAAQVDFPSMSYGCSAKYFAVHPNVTDDEAKAAMTQFNGELDNSLGLSGTSVSSLESSLNRVRSNASGDKGKRDYMACMLEARIRQLGGSADNGPVLKRNTGGAALLGGSIEQSEQWEKDRPAREAKQKADQEAASRQWAQWQKEQANKPAVQAPPPPPPQPVQEDDGSDEALAFLGAVAQVAGDYMVAQAEQEAQEQADAEAQQQYVPSQNFQPQASNTYSSGGGYQQKQQQQWGSPVSNCVHAEQGRIVNGCGIPVATQWCTVGAKQESWASAHSCSGGLSMSNLRASSSTSAQVAAGSTGGSTYFFACEEGQSLVNVRYTGGGISGQCRIR